MPRDRHPAQLFPLLVAACLAGAPAARAGDAGAPPADRPALPSSPGEIVIVGDSVPAGVYFLYLGDRTAAQGWAARVLARCRVPVPSTRLPGPFPIDHLELTRRGAGLLGFRYLKRAAGALLASRDPLFEEGEVRSVVAIPGQTLEEVLHQSSDRHDPRSTGWLFGSLFLPRHLTAVETVERAANRPRWIVLSIGANDLLSPFGIVGGATAPTPAAFERDYRELTRRLRAAMDPASRPEQLLCVTVPDVTRLPFLQPVPAGATDADGGPLPPGTVSSAFLLPYGRSRFEDPETWTPEELEQVRALTRSCNDAIRRIARDGGFSVVELAPILERLSGDPDFDSPRSPWFSPDLHHPSARLHAVIADSVLAGMARVAGVPVPPRIGLPDPPLPATADLDREERERARSFTRIALLGMERGYFPPGPTLRGAFEIAALAGGGRPGTWAGAVLAGLEIGPAPVTTRWVSRLALQARTGIAWDPDRDDFRRFPARDSELRIGLGFEPLGRWAWRRIEAGARLGLEGGPGWYARGEWRKLYAECSSDGLSPRLARAGFRFGGVLLRPGHNGN